MITKYGYDVVATAVAVVVLGSLLVWFFVDIRGLKFGIIGGLVLLLFFTLSFFRDPDRMIPAEPGAIV